MADPWTDPSEEPGERDEVAITVWSLKDVEAWVAALGKVADNDEFAHRVEDELHLAVLQAVADGTAEAPAAMAELAVKTREQFGFSRWYA